MHIKYILTLALLSITSYTYSQPEKKPNTLNETFPMLLEMFDDTSLYNFMNTPEKLATTKLHMGLGMWMRNNWGLWGNSELKRYFNNIGVFHPDDMSAIILTSFHSLLNKKDIALDKQVEYYKSFWAGIEEDSFNHTYLDKTKQDEIEIQNFIQNLTIGDTIKVYLSATEKKLLKTKYSSIGAYAVIVKHLEDNIIALQLISIMNEPNKVHEHIVGDTIERPVISCILLPPRNWKRPTYAEISSE